MAEQKTDQEVKTPSPAVDVVVRREDDRKQLPRTRQAHLGGLRLKLAVMGSVEGHHMYWANDQDAEIERLLETGFGFVYRDEVQKVQGIVHDGDVDNRVSKYVGTREDGTPYRAYLMKCTDEVWAEIQQDGQDAADAWDANILRGMVEPDSSRYIPQGFEPKIASGIRGRR